MFETRWVLLFGSSLFFTVMMLVICVLSPIVAYAFNKTRLNESFDAAKKKNDLEQ